MVSPPATLCGIAALVPSSAVAPRPLAEGEIHLRSGGSAIIQSLAWSLDDFQVDDPALAASCSGGTVVTYRMQVTGTELHLEQRRSIFWTSADMQEKAAHPGEGSQSFGSPHWRKRSNRFWPYVDGVAAPFLGQGRVGEAEVYLFGSPDSGILLHTVLQDEQDVEDHYDHEEQR